MHHKNKSKEAKAASNRVIVASVTKEMAKPRVAGSALRTAHEQSKKRHGKPTRHHVRGTAKTHIEQYSIGTPPVERKS
jgi:hypothetical protein